MGILEFLFGVAGSLTASKIDRLFRGSDWVTLLNDIATDFSNVRGSKAFDVLFINEIKCNGESKRKEILSCLKNSKLPSKSLLVDGLMERWDNVRNELLENERAEFFNIERSEALKEFNELAERINAALVSDLKFLDSALFKLEINIIDEVRKLAPPPTIKALINKAEHDENALNSIFPGSSVDVHQLFVEPIYELTNIEKEEVTPSAIDICSFAEKKLITQNILFVFGGYGSGKSILLKKFRKNLDLDASRTIFYTGSDWRSFINTNPNIERLCCEIEEYNETTCLIIDSLEDCVDLKSPDSDKFSWVSLGSIFKSLSRCSNLKIIISMRDIFPDIAETCINLSFLYHSSNLASSDYIYLKPFKSEQRNQWVDSYLFALEKEGEHHQIRNFLKNKNVRSISSNPLSLFIFSDKIASESLSINTISTFEYYDYFVNKTVKGKFYIESKRGSYFLDKHDLIEEYRQFLKEAAVVIFNNSIEKKRALDSQIDYSKVWPIDPNVIIHSSSYSKVKDISTSFIEKNTNLSLKTEKNKNEIMATLLSCYFFHYTEDKVKFKDNNVLHYFLSEYFLELLMKQSSLYAKDSQNYSLKFDDLNLITGVTIEFLVWRIIQLDTQQYNEVAGLVSDFISERFYENSKRLEKFHLSKKSLTLEIIFYIISLKLNWFSDESSKKPLEPLLELLKYEHFFKLGYKSLLYRNFASCEFRNAEIQNVDLSDYNFSNSKIFQTTFTNCQFSKTLFNYMKCGDLKFVNCSFKDVNIDSLEGKITLKNCTFSNVNFRKIRLLSLKISGGRIVKVNFSNSDYKKHELVEIKNKNGNNSRIEINLCMINQIAFNCVEIKNEPPHILVSDCFIDKFSVKKSYLIMRVTNSYRSGKGRIENSINELLSSSDNNSIIKFG